MNDVSGTPPSGPVPAPIDGAFPPRRGRLRTMLRITAGLGLDDLQHTGRAELGGLIESLRRAGRAVYRLRRHPALSGDLLWRLSGIMVTALLACLLRSPVTLALAQAAVVAALTIALNRNRNDSGPIVPVQGQAHDSAMRAPPYAGSASSAWTGQARPLPGHPTRLIPADAALPVPPEAGREAVVLCRVIAAPAQFLVVVTVVDLPARITVSG